jgi:hypothetical protein
MGKSYRTQVSSAQCAAFTKEDMHIRAKKTFHIPTQYKRYSLLILCIFYK